MITTAQCINERLELAKKTIVAAEIPALFYVDENKDGCLASFGAMLNKYPTNDYRLHLQDDLMFADNIIKYLPRVENHMRTKDLHVLSLFAPNRKLILKQYEEGKVIAPFPNYLWLQATMFSPQFQSVMKKEYNNLSDKSIKDDDVFVAHVMKKYNVKAYVHLPSIVQHNTDIKSSLGHANSKNRESKVFDKDYINNLLKPKQ